MTKKEICGEREEMGLKSSEDIRMALEAIWEKVLDINEAGNKGFFFSGGDSLKYFKLQSDVENHFNCIPDWFAFLEDPTLKNLEKLIVAENEKTVGKQKEEGQREPQGKRENSQWIEVVEKGLPLPLTPLQQAYFIGRKEADVRGERAFATQVLYSIETEIAPSAMEEAVNKVIENQAGLRLRFNDQYTMTLEEKVDTVDLPVEDISHMEEEDKEFYLAQAFDAMKMVTFDIERSPLMMMRAYKKEEGLWEIFFLIDMLVADGLSMRIFLKEVKKALEIKTTKDEPNYNFIEFVLKRESLTEGEEYQRSKEYWMNKLEDFPAAPQLPEAGVKSTGPAFGRVTGVVDKDRWAKVKEVLKKKGITPSAYLLSIYGKLLHSYSGGSKRFAVNLPVFSKDRADDSVGDFTSILLFDMEPAGQTEMELALQIQNQMLMDMNNLSFDGVEFMRLLRQKNPERTYDVVFTSMIHGEHEDSGESIGKIRRGYSQTSQVKLDCQLYEEEGELVVNFDYRKSRLSRKLVEKMFKIFRGNVEIAYQSTGYYVAEEDLELYERVNDTEKIRDKTTLIKLFERAVKEHPHKTAIEEGAERITYELLDRRANLVAGYLLSKGASGESCIVTKGKSINGITNILGVLKIGAAFVPVDEGIPEERIKNIQNICGATIILEEDRAGEYMNQGQGKERDIPPQKDEQFQELAYVIFTSGSTGMPKGVAISHDAAVNTIEDINERYNVTSKDRVLGVSSIGFDLSIYDIFGTFATGATLIISEDVRDTHAIIAQLEEQNITIWNSVPSIMKLVTDVLDREANSRVNERRYFESFGQMPLTGTERVFALRTVMLSGDFIPLSLPDAVKRHFVGAAVHSLGGATEGSIWSICYEIEKIHEAWTTIPYGYPMTNQQFYVLNESEDLCPADVAGELCIGGSGVAEGYYGDVEKTKASFFCHSSYGRLYRTGDQGVLSHKGYFEIKGRIDNQVKINGYRIELDEITTVMEELDEIDRAVIQVNRRPHELRGYYTAREDISPNSVKMYLHKKLPSYMVPEFLMQIEAVPLTENGKVDGKALLAMRSEESVGVESGTDRKEELLTKTEKEILDIWKENLSAENISVHDGFLELGGDSLGMITVVNAINSRYRCHISFGEFVSLETIHNLAAFIDRGKAEGDAGDEIQNMEADFENRHEPFPLTDIQMAYLVGRSRGIFLGGIGTQAFYDIETRLDIHRLENALNCMVLKNPMLRTIFDETGTQRILKRVPRMEIDVIDIRHLSPVKQEEFLKKEREKYTNYEFDVEVWPLFLVKGYRISDKVHRIFSNFDLLICDGISMRILIEQLLSLYDNRNDEVEEDDFTFRDYVLAAEGQKDKKNFLKAKEYWRKKADLMAEYPQLPMKTQPDQVQTPRFSRVFGSVAADRWNVIKDQASKEGVTPSVYLLNAYGSVLGRYSGQKEYTINLTVFKRQPFHKNVETMVGDFSSIMLVSLDEKGNSREENRDRTQKALLEDMEHRDYSGIQVGQYIASKMGRSNQLLFPVVFTSMLFNEKYNMDMDKIGEVKYSVSQTSQVYLDCQVMENNGDLNITWDYVEQLYDEDMIEAMFAEFLRLIENPQVEAGLRPEERKVIENYNDTEIELPVRNLHESLKKHSRTKGERVAVKDEAGALTYRELDKASDQVATMLIAKGVKKGDAVGVYGRKEKSTVVNLFGILKAGAVYVPVGDNYPEERIQYIFQKSNCVMSIDRDFPRSCESLSEVDCQEALQQRKESVPEDIAYIIFTSGSTGKPKGVVVTHGQAMNTIMDINERFSIDENDRIIGLSAFSFDLSVYDIFGAVHAGAMVYIPEDNRDMELIENVLREEEITVWNTVPAIMELYINAKEKKERKFWEGGERIEEIDMGARCHLRRVLLSGDYIPLSLPDRTKKMFPGAEVYSLGGATEGSIWSIYYPIGQVEPTWNTIPYGYPLGNQKMYILDSANRLCPLGVRGEITIGGEGVAVGYCNDQEKTDAAFIHHEELGYVYKTGDYGAMTRKGYMEFYGRIDNQIKIGGHRIELEEIEAIILEHKNIKAAKVVRSTRNKNALVGLYISEGEVDESKLKTEMTKKLPPYMIPATLLQIDEIPLNINGKVDNKKLAEIEGQSKKMDRAKRKPVTKTEIYLTDVVEKIMDCTDLGLDDNLYELGADSIKTIELYNILKQDYEVEIGDIFRYQTIEQIARVMKRKTGEEVTQLENLKKQYDLLMDTEEGYDLVKTRYENYLDRIRGELGDKKAYAEKPLGNILLTGGTGYLGSYMLRELLTGSDSPSASELQENKIFLLLRNGKGMEEVKEKMNFYFPEMDLSQYQERMEIVHGDVGKSALGLEEGEYEKLAQVVDSIFHCAGMISHFAKQEEMEQVNQESVRSLCQFAEKGKRKTLHHMSTTRLLENDGDEEFSMYTEYSDIEKDKFSDMYSESKYKAEKIIEEYRKRGCDIRIYRIGTILFDSQNGKFQKNIDDNSFYQIMKSFFNLGIIPDLDFEIIDFSFVDYTAKAIVLLAGHGKKNENYHVFNNHKLSTGRLYDLLKKAGLKEEVEKFHFDKFYEELYTKYANEQDRKYIDVLLLHSESYMSLEGITSVKLSDKTEMLLRDLGFTWPRVENEHLKKMLTYGRKVGFFEEAV